MWCRPVLSSLSEQCVKIVVEVFFLLRLVAGLALYILSVGSCFVLIFLWGKTRSMLGVMTTMVWFPLSKLFIYFFSS